MNLGWDQSLDCEENYIHWPTEDEILDAQEAARACRVEALMIEAFVILDTLPPSAVLVLA